MMRMLWLYSPVCASYNNGACASPSPCNDECLRSGPGGHCKMGIHSYGSATSPDGVHWTDHGTMMTQFDEGRTCPATGSGSGSVWRAEREQAGRAGEGQAGEAEEDTDTYVINFSHGGVIRFMTGPTPAGPWTPVGSTTPANKTFADGFGPGRRPARPQDGREWYDGRWDTANGWPAPASPAPASPSAPTIYFWISATAIGPNNTKQIGHASSRDGISWEARPPAVVTGWGNHTFKGGPFESGGCAFAASSKKWYCLNGFRGQWMSVDGTRGMATFVSDSPGGPYAIAAKNPLIMSYKSCLYLPGSCDAATYFARFWLRYDVADPSSPPELLVVHYWPQNDLMKGAKVPPAQLLLGRPPRRAGGAGPLGGWAGEGATLDLRLDNRNGTVLEGSMPGCAAGAVAFYSSTSRDGYPAYELSVDSALVFKISLVTRGKHPKIGPARTVLEVFDRSIAAPAGGDCDFKLLLRGSMAEVYVNTVLTLPFALPNTVSAGGYNQTGAAWASGARAPTIHVGLSGAWATRESTPLRKCPDPAMHAASARLAPRAHRQPG